MDDRYAQGEPGSESAASGVAERIIAAARDCFERQGFKKTKIEHIADAVGVARQTVYNHFTSKQDIIDHIAYREMRKVQDDLRKKIAHRSNFADHVTEVILQSVLLSLENPYLSQISGDPEATPLSKGSGLFFEWRTERWRSTLDAGRAADQLRPDLSNEQIVEWFSFSQWSLLLRMTQSPMSVPQLRAFIREFMVESVLSNHGAASSELGARVAALQAKLAEVKEAVVDQALEIKALRAHGQPPRK